MLKGKKIATMKDIVKLSGVSKGTIDRVIHDRGDVSAETSKKVLDIIKEIGYEPNIHASMLSLKKPHTIIAIIPQIQRNEYWELVYDGIIMAESYAKQFNVTIEIIYFNQFDINSFKTACSHTITLNPSAVLLTPIYKEYATLFANELHEKKIPLVYIDSKIDKTQYLAYFGIPQFESGCLAAHLLFGNLKSVEMVNFNIDRGSAPPNETMQNRYKGLISYAEEHNIECKIHDCSILPNDFMHNIRVFDTFFEEHPHIDKIITLSSRVYMLSEWMEIRDIRNKTLIGFDILKKNINGIKKGYISTLIAERTSQQTHNAILAIIDFVVLKKHPKAKDNYTSIDILNRYNIDFYI